MRDRRLCAALRRLPTAASAPEPDARYLRDLLHLEHRAEDRVTERHILDRVLAGRHRLPELTRPLRPGGISPEVIDPEEAALLEIQPEARRFGLRQPDRADVRR